ncbi:zinc-binding dehydrogenase [Micromonospora sp. NPDC049559]|uniref:zinc-binding dehydrogenase n=1 Tax=Micromonospora sp. NPDC049559 TaxID=3155923 RepID=UPI0034220FF0
MLAIEVDRFGGPEVLVPREVPDPVPGAGEAVVDVAAADVLWVETMIRQGRGAPYFPIEPPYRPGVGVAGVVAAVGAGVDPGWVGRRVVTRTGANGGYVQRALVPADGLVPVPDAVEPAVAAALLHDGVTALGLVDVVRIEPGDRVLVTAAGGGLGVLLVQLALAAGARVVAAARGTAKLRRLADLGADTVDYSEPDWAARVRSVVGGLDVVLDGAGGAYGRAAFDLLAPGGRFSAHGMPSGEFAVADPAVARERGVTATGIERVQFSPEEFRRYLVAALDAAAAGHLTPLIGQTFPLTKAADAHAAIEARAVTGKTLLLP